MERILILFLIFLILFSPSLLAEKVRYCIDGDTIILINNERVRLLGINAPEISHREKIGEFYGQESMHFLEKLLKGREITLEGDSLQPEFDRYGRKLAYVYLPDGTFINEVLVREGYAEVFRKYDFKYEEKFLHFEEEAKEKKLGMWSNPEETRKRFWLNFLEDLDNFVKRLK